MSQRLTTSMRATALLICLALIVGCGGNKRATKDKNAEPVVDMTRPPVTIGAEREVVVESDPNETISFEEWRRQQAEGNRPDESEPDQQGSEPEDE